MPISTRSVLVSVSVAVAMTLLFWWPLYAGAGFIGGDLYPYFFPQKAFYADCLKEGVFPLWNDLAGFGYPVLGESQTGAAYPFHFVFYRAFDLNTAYNIEHLLHYVICFVGTWLFAKRLDLSDRGACLAALVFTYGWFPPRACLEWAIITGAWMPVALWCVESFLQTRYWRYAIGLSAAIGLQLLAGHFHLAFITDLLIVTYVPYRLWGERREPANANPVQLCRKKAALGLMFGLVAGACLASIQLLPTWELKQRSSRVVTGGDYDPAYGHLPPAYLSQAILPWQWYSLWALDEDNLVRDIAEFAAPWHWFGPLHEPGDPKTAYDLERSIQRCKFGAVTTGTNKVEAHFYCGLVPIGMAICAALTWFTTLIRLRKPTPEGSLINATKGYWLIAGLIALVYATGLLLPIGRHLPGFSFFRGPGRYGIVTTLTVALLAGQFLDEFSQRISTRFLRSLLLIVAFGSTAGDLWLVSRMVKYTAMVSPPRISFRESSEVRRRLNIEPTLPRLLAPGPNVGNLLGVSCVPWYLGIAPAEYVDPQIAMPPIPKPLGNNAPTPGSFQLIEWLSRSGVTHVLNFEPLEEASWNVELVWKGVDPFLNRVWGREEPIHLYRFKNRNTDESVATFPGRTYLIDGAGKAIAHSSANVHTNSRSVTVESDQPATLILTELNYPGWRVSVNSNDNSPANFRVDSKESGLFRSVQIPAGKSEVTWTYHPWSVTWGALISLSMLVLLASIAHMRFWHPKLVDRLLASVFRRCGLS